MVNLGVLHVYNDDAQPICTRASSELIDQLVKSSPVEVTDLLTCWLCTAIEHWLKESGMILDNH